MAIKHSSKVDHFSDTKLFSYNFSDTFVIEKLFLRIGQDSTHTANPRETVFLWVMIAMVAISKDY